MEELDALRLAAFEAKPGANSPVPSGRTPCLQKLHINNDLANGRFMADGAPVALQDIRTEMFVIAAERDHVAPWHSVCKIHRLTGDGVTFLLTNGGHNAGIVSEPDHYGRHDRIAHHKHRDPLLRPDQWVAGSEEKSGSWWTSWSAWLAARSSPEQAKPPAFGAPRKGYPVLDGAPGTSILQR